MRGTILLKSPIEINGQKRVELKYDTNAITCQAYGEACEKKFSSGTNRAGAIEIDYTLHLYLGFAAIIALDSSIDYSDLERVSGSDIFKIANVGRNFIMNSENSEQESLDELSETTQESTTPQQKNSDEKA